MQINTVATYLGPTLGFAAIADGLAVVESGGYVRLIYADRFENRLASLTLATSVSPAAQISGGPVIGSGTGVDLALQATPTAQRVYVYSSQDGLLRHASLGSTGAPGLTNGTSTSAGYLFGVTSMEMIERGETDFSVVAQRGVPGLKVFSHSAAGVVSYLSTLTDGPKSYLADVTDLAAVTVSGHSYLLTSSALENGLSLFEINSAGAVSFVDAMGAQDGLPLGGPAAMQTVAIGAQQYVVVAATNSSSLTVVRVNEMGVMFLADHLIDDRATRFAGAAALDVFSWAGRAFVVAAGTDRGVSVIEVLPDGQLSPIVSLPLETGAGIANVTGIETTIIGQSAEIFLTDAGGDRIYHFSVPLAGISGIIQSSPTTANATLTGTALDDRMIGSAFAETLQGGTGDDFLHDGGGNDLLVGGTGADVFVFGRDNSADRIGDFQTGIDRLDVSAWGRIYSAASLAITATATGAVVSYGSESLTITQSAGGSLLLTDADFIF